VAEAAGLASVLLEFPEGRAVQIVRRHVPGRGGLRLQITTTRGQIVVALPRRVQWNDAEGTHSDILPRPRPPLQLLLERFHQAVKAGQSASLDLELAGRTLTWLRAIARSRAKGRKVEVR